jgi:PTS system nitrogen regulatory IIA component
MRIAELLSKGRVWHNIAGDDPAGAIRDALLTLYGAPGIMAKDGPGFDELCRSATEREELASTALGSGLAVPHPRSPLCKRPEDSLVALFYPRFPIAWESPDGLPVRAFFIILSANSTEHLANLSSLSKLCMKEGFVELLLRESGLDELAGYLKGAS